MIDLHFHSTCSDGDVTPEALAASAKAKGLYAVALTDHDTTDGTERFLKACAAQGVRAAAGVEISAEYNPGTMHMLGYFIDVANGPLQDALHNIRDGREIRNEKIFAKLASLGMPLTREEVSAFAGGDVIGRPHLAQAMIKRGYVKSKEEAFGLYLAKGQPAYVPRYHLSPADSIAVIRGAGGIAVLAHPFTVGLGPEALEREVAGLVEAGLGGIEVHYSEHTPSQQEEYERLARRFNLLVTGGSDYHGSSTPDLELGRGFGNLRIPDALFDALARAAGHAA